MSTLQERKNLLKQQKKENHWWTIIVYLWGIGFAYSLFNVVIPQVMNLFSSNRPDGFWPLITILTIAVEAWTLWGIYRLERWVLIWLWINIGINVLAFNIVNYVAIILFVLVMLAYKKILKVVYPNTATLPTS